MSASQTPHLLDRESVRAVDRAAIDEYGIPGIVLMENAARGLAAEALRMLRGAANEPPRVLIICGRGNNGGDGYALARHLHNAGIAPVLAPLGEPPIESDAGINDAICRRMGIRRIALDALEGCADADLVVDAIFGTGLDRPVSGEAARIIDWINGAGRPVLAVDVPSGLDCDTGRPLGTAVRATRTVTFVGLKPGLARSHAAPLVGEVVVVDIGAPVELTHRFGGRRRDEGRGTRDE